MKYRKEEALLFCSSLALCLPPIVRPYLWADAFPYFGKKLNSQSGEIVEIKQNLRPIYAWFVEKTSNAIEVGLPINFLYLLAWFANSICAILFYRYIIKLAFPNSIAFLAGMSIVSLPTFQNYTHDLVMWPMNYLLLTILLAYGRVYSRPRYYYFATGIIIFAAMAIYQPLATFPFILIGLKVLSSIFQKDFTHKTFKIAFDRAIKDSFALTIQLVTSYLFILYWATVSIGVLSNRIGIVSSLDDLFNKVVWITSVWIPTFLRPYFVSTSNAAVIFTLAISVFPILAYLRFWKEKSVQEKLVLCSFPFFSFVACTTHLVIKQNQFEFRAFPGLTLGGVLWLSVIYFKSSKSNAFKRHLDQILYSVTIISVLMAFLSSWNLWIAPTYARDSIVENVLKQGPNVVCQVIPDSLLLPKKRLGIYSLKNDISLDWVNNNIWNVSLRNRPEFDLRVITVAEEKSCPTGSTIVDFSILDENPEFIPSL